MEQQQTRYFKLIDHLHYYNHYEGIELGVPYLKDNSTINPDTRYTYLFIKDDPCSHTFYTSDLEEVFNYVPNAMNVIDEGVAKYAEKVVDDNGVKCVYRDGIREFETGAVRSDNRGRERYDLIPQLGLDMAAEVFGKNCGEFGSGNHLKCLPEAVCVESLLRHQASLKRYLQGVGELHEEDVASMVCNVLMLAHTVRAKKLGLYNKKHNW